MTQIPAPSTPESGVARNAVVVVVDGLSAAMLGAYGNTWFETSSFNRLAAKSLLFDYAFASSTNLEQSYQRFWKSESGTDRDDSSVNPANQNLIDTIANLGASTSLLTDEPRVGETNLADSFDHVVQFASESIDKIAETAEQTELANFFAQATNWVINLEPGSFGWIHSRGLTGAWDAPYEVRAGLAGEGDPEPGEFCQPPVGKFDLEKDDPDDLLGYQQACAAQVILLDQFLGVLLDLMETDPIWKSTLLCFVSSRGYPLGEHGILGHCDSSLSNYNESVHVPVMICPPNSSEFGDFQAIRNRSLVQTDLIGDCLVDWFDDDPNRFADRLRTVAFDVPELRDQAVVIDSQAGDQSLVSIQTHAWKLIKKVTTGGVQANEEFELYGKPDDRWEVNDVSRRCPQIVEALAKVLDSHFKAGGLGGSGSLGLAEELWTRAN